MIVIKLLINLSLSNLTILINSVESIIYHNGSILHTKNFDLLSNRKFMLAMICYKISLLFDTF